jgi:hypothetical protein
VCVRVCVCVCFDVGWVSVRVLKKGEEKRIEGRAVPAVKKSGGALFCVSSVAPSQQKCKRVVEREGGRERERSGEGYGAREMERMGGREWVMNGERERGYKRRE